MEESRREFAEAFQRDLESVLEESRRMYEEENSSLFLEEQKAIEESKRNFQGEIRENHLINQSFQETLRNTSGNQFSNCSLASQDDEIQAAMLISALSSFNTQAYQRDELSRSPIVAQ